MDHLLRAILNPASFKESFKNWSQIYVYEEKGNNLGLLITKDKIVLISVRTLINTHRVETGRVKKKCRAALNQLNVSES